MLACAGLAMLVAGCDVGPDYRFPVFPFAASYAAKTAGTPVYLENVAWWERFGDPALNGLIEAGLAGNLDLAVARERVIEAQALVRTVPSEVATTGTARAGLGGGDGIADGGQGDVTFGLSWLLDPWGGRRSRIRAATGRAEAAAAELDAARLLLLSNIATAYIDLRFFERSAQLRREELASRRKTLDLVRELAAGNAGTRLDVVRAEALVAQTRSLIPEFDTAAQAQRNRLAVLLGQSPSQPVAALKAGSRGQPISPMPADIGIPADLLRNRPDLRLAERFYYASVADIGAARADLYPALSLSGEVSLSSIVGVSGTEYFFGPSIRLPALPDGDRRAQVEVRESRARAALTQWQGAVLAAIEQVESALVSYSGSRAAVGSARETVRLYREAVTLTRELAGRDGATVRDLLDDERSVASANIVLAQNLRQLGRDYVVLNVSLGSGYGAGLPGPANPPGPPGAENPVQTAQLTR
ncbi:MAG: efflux transporter outer membrane subunit [Marinibacterium sp.]